ncbi:hypothetical protein [Pararhodospirillum oryzae]|uniref:Uncharacterized protein n=1 Tax=Pararhodospirillum oryzae TaxID=478448 RepID=A0A512HC56_9PROT|nr:hypothetical protein [Pararhodospirillum oryzae]GEO83037.1 hypothetical protein ROR02_31680 [Pararhodospirillum oryzae]
MIMNVKNPSKLLSRSSSDNGAETLATGHDVARQVLARARELLGPSQRTRSDFCAPLKRSEG